MENALILKEEDIMLNKDDEVKVVPIALFFTKEKEKQLNELLEKSGLTRIQLLDLCSNNECYGCPLQELCLRCYDIK